MNLERTPPGSGPVTPPPTDTKTPRQRTRSGKPKGETSTTNLLDAINEINERTRQTDILLQNIQFKQREQEVELNNQRMLQQAQHATQVAQALQRDQQIEDQREAQQGFQVPPLIRQPAFREGEPGAPNRDHGEDDDFRATSAASGESATAKKDVDPLHFDEVKLATHLLEWSLDSRNIKKVKTRDREEIDFLHKLLKYRHHFSDEDRKTYKKRLRLFYVVADINWNPAIIDRNDFGIVLSDRTTASRAWKRGGRGGTARASRSRGAPKRGK